MSPGSSSTGSRLIVASAAPVTMFVAPGPIEVVHAQRRQPVAHAGVADGGVHHRLLVARQHVGQPLGIGELGLEQRLPDARHVAVAEDAEAAGDQPLLDAVALGVLVGQEPHQRLGHRQPPAHAVPPRARQRQSGIDLLVRPGDADPGVGGVVAEAPDALARARPSR